MNNLTLVIPAKNEKESLPTVLNELAEFNLKTFVILEKDDLETIESIENYDCKLIYQSRKGFGSALIQGIENVNTKYFCIFNADGSFDPNELQKMYNLAEKEKYDLVLVVDTKKMLEVEDDTIVSAIGNKVFSLIGKIFFSLGISDILYTYVICDNEKIKKLRLKNADFSFCVELPIKAKKEGLSLISTNSYERKRIGGIKKVNAFKDGFLILIQMIKLFFYSTKNKQINK